MRTQLEVHSFSSKIQKRRLKMLRKYFLGLEPAVLSDQYAIASVLNDPKL